MLSTPDRYIEDPRIGHTDPAYSADAFPQTWDWLADQHADGANAADHDYLLQSASDQLDTGPQSLAVECLKVLLTVYREWVTSEARFHRSRYSRGVVEVTSAGARVIREAAEEWADDDTGALHFIEDWDESRGVKARDFDAPVTIGGGE